MISQQNLLLQLSGNRIIIVLIALGLLISCASSTPARGTKVLDPDKHKEKEEEVVAIPVDTVQWTVVPEEDSPPITSDDARVESYLLEKVKKDYYKIALLLPFRIDESIAIPNLSSNNEKFASFYAGMKLAGKEQADVRISVKTYYTDRDLTKLSSILEDMDRDQPDLIIGSYDSAIISKTAEWAKSNRVPLISPWGSSTKITEENVFYLQLRPSITNYYEKMLEHINDNFDRYKVYMLGREERADQTMFRVIRRINERNSPLPEVTPYNELILSMDQLMNEDSLFIEVLEEGAQAFILPQYASTDDAYVYSCLRKLYAEKGDSDIYIYTMPMLLNSDRIDINIFKNINTRTCEFRFPDPRNPDVQNFRSQYYNSYGWLPTKDSYYGYDVMKFIAYGLENHGQYFHYYMQNESLDLMQMKINIKPYHKVEGSERPDFLVNDHLYLIEFDTDHFDIKDIR
ncbi:MAG: hypothetical protein ACI9FN_000567 [Saprospiraceae bacterium]|jgi:hypothetical protein